MSVPSEDDMHPEDEELFAECFGPAINDLHRPQMVLIMQSSSSSSSSSDDADDDADYDDDDDD
eukprot:4900706-Karenia_brevis.AAC.1